MYPLLYTGIEGIVIRFEDVTELEKKDRQLLQAQKMETVGNLAGGLAHDFNNVLGGIVGTTSLIKFLLEKGEIIDIENIKSRIDVIEKGAVRAVDLVKQLLTLSRKSDPLLTPVDINQSLKHVMKICENTFDKSILIFSRFHDSPSMIWADATQIEQVLLNLCVNASHAMTIMRKKEEQQGGVLTVSVIDFESTPEFRTNHVEAFDKKYWKIQVHDTGVGIDNKNLQKIFDPFFTTKAATKGTGLGLAMVYNIIQQHKGFIDVNSKMGEGTTFDVYFPQLEEKNYVSENLKRVDQLIKGNGLILVIDDEESLRNTTKELLETCGYSVLLAKDGREGVDIYSEKNTKIDAILMDMAMPIMSGKDAYIELKNINPSLKVLLTSGFRHDPRVKEAMNLGVNGFIQKPFSLVELSKKLSEILHS